MSDRTRQTADYGHLVSNRNHIINGAFDVWQRGDSFIPATSGTYIADRWKFSNGSGDIVNIEKVVNSGLVSYSGHTPTNVLKAGITANSGTYNWLQHRIEDVRTLAGNTVAVSFWIFCNIAGQSCSVTLQQNFGSGGSSIVSLTPQTFALNDSVYQEIKCIFDVPSIAGKTVGDDSYLQLVIELPIDTTLNIYIANVQLEQGVVVTPFEIRPIQQELNLCYRYYYQVNYDYTRILGFVNHYTSVGTNVVCGPFPIPTIMRPGASITATELKERAVTSRYALSALNFLVSGVSIMAYGTSAHSRALGETTALEVINSGGYFIADAEL